MAIWQQLKAGKIVPEIDGDVAIGLHTNISSGADCEHAPSTLLTGKGMIDDAVEQISRLWDEVDHSEGATAWEWIMRRSHHGGIIRGAEERVDIVGSGGDPDALLSACNSWVAAWRNGIEAWKKLKTIANLMT
jgi:hypothetical protein